MQIVPVGLYHGLKILIEDLLSLLALLGGYGVVSDPGFFGCDVLRKLRQWTVCLFWDPPTAYINKTENKTKQQQTATKKAFHLKTEIKHRTCLRRMKKGLGVL